MLPLAFLLLFGTDPVESLDKELKKFADVFAALEREAADRVDIDRAFYEGAIPGMLRRLDPHSVFFDPGQFQQLKQMEKSERKGFGTVVSVLPGRVIILQTLPGSPSAKAGLSPGDEILGINGYPLSRLSFEQLVELLTEARQHEAQLVVRHPGNSRLLQFVLKPELMDSPSVDRTFMLTADVGYIRLTSFDAPTGKAVKEAVEKLGGEKLKGLVIDLRDNPGGVAEAALETAALFLKPGQRVLSIRGRAKEAEDVDVPKDATPYEFPIAVLMNGKSASASEIVAGALQDHDRAVIVGEPSYGKGLVQSVFPLSSSTGLALTVAYYYTPSGRSIQKPLHGGQLDAATSANAGQYRTDAGRTVAGGGGIQPDEVAYPNQLTPLGSVIEQSGAFASFAADYLQKSKIDENFTVKPALLDDFQLYLADHHIQPSMGQWMADREWIQFRLQQEMLNLAFGVAKGDVVEVQHDPVVRRALNRLLSAGARR